MLDFRILGPLEVRNGGGALHLGGTKQRGVLALLLLRPNEVVSTDRLIDELWGDAPPEDASMALQAHVSRLRKALPGGSTILVTQSPGYLLRIDPAQLDLQRFHETVRDGRAALEADDPERAAATLRSALALWRGRPLADLEDEPYARDAAGHLEEAWLEALGSRIDADLALGRHAELVPELRALVKAHPLREGLRVQLMLALYRSGRQADALDVYADARRALKDELGLEPGPALQRLQQQILTQDPALELAPRPTRRQRRRRSLALVAVALVLVAAASVAATAVVASERNGPAYAASDGALVAIDAESGRVGRSIQVGNTPTAVAVGEGAVWVIDADAQTISSVDPDEGAISTFATGATPTDLAVGAGHVWVGNGRRLSTAQFIGPVTTSVARIDPVSHTGRDEVQLPLSGASLSNLTENHLAVTKDALWAVTPYYSLVRIDARSGAPTKVMRQFPVQAVAAGPAGVWALGADGSVARLDEETGDVLVRTRVPATSVAAIGVGEDAAWVTSTSDGTLWRIVPGDKPRLGSIDVGEGAGDVTVGSGSVWVANPLSGTLTQVATESSAVVRTIPVGGVPRSLAVDGSRVWVALSNLDVRPSSTASSVGGVHALPLTSCEPVLYGGEAEPDVLIASDLMLQGGERAKTTQMEQAIAFVLRERGFRAGDFKVAYQSCDDSLATTRIWDAAKCAANARAFAANPDVVGVIGTFNSGCAAAEIPILNRAPNGGVAMVSPTNSLPGLTRQAPGAPASELAKLYPTGKRNYLRVYPTEDLQMAALAIVAKRLGHKRVALLDDGDRTWSAPFVVAFQRAARRLGIRVVLRESWDPQAKSYRGLVQGVARSGAEAVVLTGILDNNSAEVVRELRQALGRDVDLLGNDRFTPIPVLMRQAGSAALGMYVSLNGLTNERLGPAGKRFVRAFAASQSGSDIHPFAVYAAQATEVLLDAIARSDGTRASVIDELFRTKVMGGLVGDFTFDANGDVSQRPITILRVRRAGGDTTIQSDEDAEIVSIEHPQASLVR